MARPDRPAQLSQWRLATCCFFVFAPIGVQMPFFPLWLAGNGFTPGLIAALLGVAPVLRFVVNLAVPPQADRRGDAAGVLLACAIFAALAQAASGLSFGIVWVFTLSLVATCGQGPMAPLLDSIVLREVRRRSLTQEAPLDYGGVRAAGSVAVLLVMLGGGALASLTPTGAIIWLITGASAAAALAVAVLLPRGAERSGAADADVTYQRPFPTLHIALVIAASAAVQASHATIYAFGSIGWRQAGYSDAAIGELWASGVATEVAFFILANRFASGRNLATAYLVAGSATAVLRWGVMAMAPGPIVLLLIQALHAGSFAATYLGAVLSLGALAGERRRAQVQGWVSAATALTMAAATIISGPLWATYSWSAYLFPMALAAVGLVCACLVALGVGLTHPQRAGSGG